jgi:sarcosine oxidase
MKHYDVIVVGVGSMGSATCHALAKEGLKVLGLEQFTLANELSSHTGQSRLIRLAYYEHPNYVPLLKKAYKGWESIEQEAKIKLFHQTGIAYYGKVSGPLLTGINRSVHDHHLEMDTIPIDRYPQFKIPNDYAALFEEIAGFITPEKAILTFAQQAINFGAEIHQNEAVRSWRIQSDIVTIVTDKAHYSADKMIVTAGPFTRTILPNFQPSLITTRQLVAWMSPTHWNEFAMNEFPCWVIEEEGTEGIYYGFPMLPIEGFPGPIGLKLAHHRPGVNIDPSQPKDFDTDREEQHLMQMVKKYFSDTQMKLLNIRSCIYTYSSDSDFIIDYLPETHQKVIVAAGFSGHGFKFVPAIGSILADMARGTSMDIDVEFLSLARLNRV